LVSGRWQKVGVIHQQRDGYLNGLTLNRKLM